MRRYVPSRAARQEQLMPAMSQVESLLLRSATAVRRQQLRSCALVPDAPPRRRVAGRVARACPRRSAGRASALRHDPLPLPRRVRARLRLRRRTAVQARGIRPRGVTAGIARLAERAHPAACLQVRSLGLERPRATADGRPLLPPARAGVERGVAVRTHATCTVGPYCSIVSSRKRPIAGAGWAPTKPVTGLPSRKTATVGMLWMP
jgi:hypothetical protein